MKNTIIAAIVLAAVFFGYQQVRSMDDKMEKPMNKMPEHTQSAVFAGGCFWCTESDFEKVDGVIEAVSGYTGGRDGNPTYKQVSAGGTGHVEAVKVIYDPAKISYSQLLDVFWRHVDPTDAGGQFVDRGDQYRSAIFYANDEERQMAEASKKTLAASGRFDKPIVTDILPLGSFYEAEDYHQDYYKKNPIRYNWYRSGSGRDKFLEMTWAGEAMKMEKKRRANEDGRRKKTRRWSTIPTDEQLKQTLTPLQYKVTRERRHRTAIQQRILGQPRSGHLRGHRIRRAPVQLHGQVRVRNGLAELHPTAATGQRDRKNGSQLFHGPHRSAQQARRLPPGAPVRTTGPRPRDCATASIRRP